MSDARFLAEGAQSSCGSLIYKNQEVGQYRHDTFQISPLGEEILKTLESITDVEPKPVAKSHKKAKAAAPDMGDLAGELDDLLG